MPEEDEELKELDDMEEDNNVDESELSEKEGALSGSHHARVKSPGESQDGRRRF